MRDVSHPRAACAALVFACAAGCNALLDIDEVEFGAPGGSSTTSTAATSTGGSAGTGGTGGTGASAGAAGTGGAGGNGGAGGTPLGPWGTPRLVTEISDPSGDDDDPAFSADLLELFFSSTRDGSTAAGIWTSTRSSPADSWGPPSLVVELSSTSEDTNIALAPDGLTIWLTSDRDGAIEIYVAERPNRSTAWATPVLVPELNSTAADYPCSVTNDALSFLLSSSREGSVDIFQATRSSPTAAWQTPTVLPGLSSTESEYAASISGDGLVVYFDSRRNGGQDDIFRSERATLQSGFSTPVAVDELNTALGDSDPWVSQDERYIMFTRTPTPRNIYEASR